MRVSIRLITILFILIVVPATGLGDSVTILFHFEGTDSLSNVGSYIVSLGDINVDGYDDIAVSSNSPPGTYIFHGGSPADNVPDYFVRGSGEASARVDMTGDGIPDLVIGARKENKILLYRGFTDSLESQPSDSISPIDSVYELGGYVESGLVTDDSLGDLVVTDWHYPGGSKHYYYENPFAGDKEPDWEFVIVDRTHGISGMGFMDYTGDQIMDIYAGFYGDLDTSGYVYIFPGPIFRSVPDIVLIPPEGLDSLGGSRGKKQFASRAYNLGDFSGDGWDDLAVGYGNQPLIYFCGPSVDGLYDLYPETGSKSIGAAGDVNGDGGRDMILGNTRGYWGTVDVYLGGEVVDSVYDLTITDNDLYPIPAVTFANIGNRVGSAGDFNGDGYDDMLITCRNMDSPDGQPWVVYCVAGSPGIVTGIEERISITLPSNLSLGQNYPNPFNLSTTIEFQLTRRERVSLDIFNMMGRRVRTLADDKVLAAGLHRYDWDGKVSDGQVAASGTYLYRLKTETDQQARKMVLLK